MKNRRWSLSLWAVVVIACLELAGGLGFGGNQSALVPTPTLDEAESLTPPPGDPLRAAVLDALRERVQAAHGLDVVFVVRHLRVKDGWAWVQVGPQSPDGTQRYEDVSALLRCEEGLWTVAEMPCTEVDNPQCLSDPEYFAGLQKRFPGAPPGIFPDSEHSGSGQSGAE